MFVEIAKQGAADLASETWESVEKFSSGRFALRLRSSRFNSRQQSVF